VLTLDTKITSEQMRDHPPPAVLGWLDARLLQFFANRDQVRQLLLLPSHRSISLELMMPIIRAGRQLTIPADQCRLAGIEPGDECRSLVADGRIALIRQQPGSAWGCLAHLRADETISPAESRQHSIETRRERQP